MNKVFIRVILHIHTQNQLSRFQGGGGLVSADTTTTTSNKSTFNLSAVKAQLHGISNNEKSNLMAFSQD